MARTSRICSLRDPEGNVRIVPVVEVDGRLALGWKRTETTDDEVNSPYGSIAIEDRHFGKDASAKGGRAPARESRAPRAKPDAAPPAG